MVVFGHRTLNRRELSRCSVQEEIPDARRLDPGDVGGRAGEHAGFVLHGAADGPEAHHAVHLPTVPPQLAQQGAARVALRRREEEKEKLKNKKILAFTFWIISKSLSWPGMPQAGPLCPWNLHKSWSLAHDRPRTSFAGRSWSQWWADEPDSGILPGTRSPSHLEHFQKHFRFMLEFNWPFLCTLCY